MLLIEAVQDSFELHGKIEMNMPQIESADNLLFPHILEQFVHLIFNVTLGPCH